MSVFMYVVWNIVLPEMRYIYCMYSIYYYNYYYNCGKKTNTAVIVVLHCTYTAAIAGYL